MTPRGCMAIAALGLTASLLYYFLHDSSSARVEIIPTDEGQMRQELDSNGLKHGAFVLTDTEGRTLVDGKYSKGHSEGMWTWYFPSGRIREVRMMSRGNFIGLAYEFHENGRIARVGEDFSLILDGPWLYLDVQGEIDLERTGMYKSEVRERSLTAEELRLARRRFLGED